MRNDRKVGENFDEKMAGDIFDKLKNAEGKIKPKRKGRFDNITNLMQEAKSLEKENKCDGAIKLYNEVIYILPDSTKAYEALANIYKKQGNIKAEKDILQKAIANCSKTDQFENRLNDIQ
ncbi:M48 family metallopeptidase [Methanobrevibacter sp. V14]|uniref:tetratricopeptide repeat protein n=1 Tax=Methanobrevibacter sp. V14 TaxID=3064280 RepID=UPI0027347EAB|nr:hypothetical protein [Methanobrevibacter sp. V14]